ncbi:MAG TPA: hypothetical protein DCM59_03950 [Clostridium sp.]|uniref:DUF1836 domain-containing protein n=1 Tax=unclassified Clostridium TaxID=2614128 RepID=UPI000EF00763|nr:hypothetical protein [Clostridium sp.]
MNFSTENLEEFLISINLDNKIDSSKIPDIDLYIDQVIQLFENNLDHVKRNPTDKILTKTMINNYSKDKLLFQNKNKKYSKNHILLMILIYDLKQILSIADIKRLFTPMTETLSENESEFNLNSIYDEYLLLKQNEIDREKELLNSILNEVNNLCEKDTIKNYEDYKKLLLITLTLLNSASLNKRIAEKIIDTYF